MKEHLFEDAYVTVAQGILHGTVEDGIKVFRGVPYAASPVGDRRWKAPLPPARWFGVRKADRFSAGALQVDTRAGWKEDSFELSADMDCEDCLYLNLYTPAQTQEEKLPILVWLHGGGMVAGTGMAPFFEGEKLAQQGIIVVTINYRLGLFGFLCHPELSAEAPQGTSGNYALLDVMQALKWLQENAAQFGGDASRITVGGQSGGSVGASCILMSPLAQGLCSQIIMDSGCPTMGGMMDAKSLAEMEKDGATFAEKIGCHSLAELRAMDGCDLMEACTREGYMPNYCNDGYVLPADPKELLPNGRFNDMRFLVGFTTEEFGSLGCSPDLEIQPENFENYIRTVFPADMVPAMLEHYPHGTFDETRKSVLHVLSDLLFLSAVRLGAAAGEKGLPAFVYYKSRPDAGVRGQKLGSTHSSELPYLFGRPQPCAINPAGMDQDEQAFGRQLQNYWVNFVKNGTPNGKNVLVEWPQCTKLFEYMDLGVHIHPTTEDETKVLELLNDLMDQRGETSVKPYMDTTSLNTPGFMRRH